MPEPVIVWFRRDLRVDDHAALAAAMRSGRPIVPLVVLDDRLRTASTMSARRWARFLSAVAALDRDLGERGGRLVIRSGDPADVVPRLAAEVGAAEALASRSYTPAGRARDVAVRARTRLRLFGGELLVEPEATGPTRVFTPFHRRWLAAVGDPSRPRPSAGRIVVPAGIPSDAVPAIEPIGTREANAGLQAFATGPAARYSSDRDRLDLDGTSHLSADLHLGTLSPRTAFATVEAEAFRRQLAWRDWAAHLLWFDPAATGDELPWRDDPEGLRAWQDGGTGYPVVDAAMRQLAAEGWIANRARMVVASFLTKDLLIDWRAGAAHFLRQLLDADVANNLLGWRWTAGVGPDAAPYVRVLNPVLQGQRFDPHGRWVRRWVPEVAALPDALVHQPWAADDPPRGYPPPIVDHRAARERALAAFAARTRARPPSR